MWIVWLALWASVVLYIIQQFTQTESRDFKGDWFLHHSEDEPNIRIRDCEEEEEEEDNNNEEERKDREKRDDVKKEIEQRKEQTLDLQISC